MNEGLIAVAKACLAGAETNSMKFPDIVGKLMAVGFESYEIDLRRGTASYFTSHGESLVLEAHRPEGPVAAALDRVALKAAIGEAQRDVPGYTYLGFCHKAAQAGCAFYMVSFSGRRALYIGRTGETHTENFPQ